MLFKRIEMELCSVMLNTGALNTRLLYALKILCIGFFVQELMSFVRSYVLPEGFPDSVTPSYVPYMTWRALKVVIALLSLTTVRKVGLLREMITRSE